MLQKPLTDEQRKSLEAQRWELIQIQASGTRQVTHGDKTVVYKNQQEITQAIESIDRILSGKRKVRAIKVYPKRGM